MSSIHLVRKHTIGLRKAKVAAQKVADDLAQRYGMASEWEGNVLHFWRTGLTGTVQVRRNSVELEAELGFLLSMLKYRIEAQVNENFDRYFA